MTVLHLTAELAPMSGGIADHVAILGGELARRGVPQLYLVTGAAGGRPAEGSIFAGREEVIVLPEPTADALSRELVRIDPPCVLLHYSGYGFARRGAPLWLARGLEIWKARRPSARLVVMFHELWARSFNPLRSSFWLSAVQRECVHRMARLADAAVTSNGFYAARLRPFLSPGTPLHVQPLFSNVGEPKTVPPFEEREPVAVVFGLGGHRRQVYERFRAHFERLRALGIERVVEIGTEPEATAGLVWPVPCERLGRLPAADISRHLMRARFGLFDYPVPLACKSGVFVAFAAHGVVPVSPDGAGLHDGFAHGRWSICLAMSTRIGSDAGELVFRWYQQHRLKQQVDMTWLPLIASDVPQRVSGERNATVMPTRSV